MQAAVCREARKPLVLEELTLAAPEAGEVAVRVAACAVCRSDVSYLDGSWPAELPAVFGHEAAGVVEAIGPGVTRLVPGDRVVVGLVRSCGSCDLCRRGEPALCEGVFARDGRSPLRAADGADVRQGLRTAAFAESIVVHESQAVAVADGIPLDRACLLGCAVSTGFGAVANTAAVRAGESVAVIGAGGVGLSCVQAASLAGARPVVAVDPAAHRLEAARRLGASTAVEPGDAPALLRSLPGKGFDHVFVATGARTAIEQGLTLLRSGGELVLVGMPAAGVTVELDPGALAHRGQRIVGCKLGSVRPWIDVPRLVELYLGGRLELDALISGRYPLERIDEAVAATAAADGLRSVIVFPAP